MNWLIDSATGKACAVMAQTAVGLALYHMGKTQSINVSISMNPDIIIVPIVGLLHWAWVKIRDNLKT